MSTYKEANKKYYEKHKSEILEKSRKYRREYYERKSIKEAGMITIRESEVEHYFKTIIEKAGGLCFKWISPGDAGLPDRIAILNGRTFYAEIKTEKGRLSPIQNAQINRLKKHGATVAVIHSKQEADETLRGWMEWTL